MSEYIIGTQWKTKGGWRAIILNDTINGFWIWHNNPSIILGCNEEGECARAAKYDLYEPWVEPAFDWSEVKQGMAFKVHQAEIVWFVGNDLLKPQQYKICAQNTDCSSLYCFTKECLTRAPEHDIAETESP